MIYLNYLLSEFFNQDSRHYYLKYRKQPYEQSEQQIIIVIQLFEVLLNYCQRLVPQVLESTPEVYLIESNKLIGFIHHKQSLYDINICRLISAGIPILKEKKDFLLATQEMVEGLCETAIGKYSVVNLQALIVSYISDS